MKPSLAPPHFDRVASLLSGVGYQLDPVEHQVHIGDERALLSSNKLVLLGRRALDNFRIVAKSPQNSAGMREIAHERECRAVLREVNKIAGRRLINFPEELEYLQGGPSGITVFEYIEQPTRFVELPLSERLRLSLVAFDVQQELSTYCTESAIRKKLGSFETTTASTYAREARGYLDRALACYPANVALRDCTPTVQEFFDRNFGEGRWTTALVHTDLVPNNFRVANEGFYFIDLASFQLASVHESWARFLNWLMVWDPDLESCLVAHLTANLTADDLRCLSTMRAVKSAFLVQMYSSHLRSLSNHARLLTLQTGRLTFWTKALTTEIVGGRISRSELNEFARFQISLRSDREARRQLAM